MKFILTIIYIILTTSGLFLIKLGASKPLFISLSDGFTLKVGFTSLCGLLLYLCSFLLWQKVLTSFDLSFIVPIATGIVQIIIVSVGIIFFKEKIDIVGIIGAMLIIVGLILVAYGKK